MLIRISFVDEIIMNVLIYYFWIVMLFCVGLVFMFQVVVEVFDFVVYVMNQGGGVIVLNVCMFKQVDEIVVGKDLCGFVVMFDGCWLLMVNQGSVDVLVVDMVMCKEIRCIVVGRNVEFMCILFDGC